MPQDPTAPPPLHVLDHGLAMGLGVPQFTARRFTAHPDSLRTLKPFIRRTLRDWDALACLSDTLTVAGELAANAAHHAPDAPDGRTYAWLALARTAYFVLCTVTDPSRCLPDPTPPVEHPTGHRCRLRTVHQLSEDWGYTLLTDTTGKTVWACLRY